MHCRTFNIIGLGLDMYRIAEVRVISHSKWTDKEVFSCQVHIQEATYDQRDGKVSSAKSTVTWQPIKVKQEGH